MILWKQLKHLGYAKVSKENVKILLEMKNAILKRIAQESIER